MSQANELLRTLKRALKSRGRTYADVAAGLGLSEASVKRLFSQRSVSLERLEQICALLDLEISDLVRMMTEQQTSLEQLTVEQEREITDDLELLLVTVCVLNRWTMEEIVSFYDISEGECFRKLARLDKLKIIDLLPGNRFRLRVAANFSWRANGPIQQFFQQTIGQEFFNSRFTRDDECLLVLNGMLASTTNAELQRKLRRLAREFEQMNSDDASRPLDQRNGVTLVLAMRDWRYGLFQSLRDAT